MDYLIDTCVFAEYANRRPNKAVIDWLDGQLDDSLYLSVLTIGEIEKGIIRMPDSARKRNLEIFLEEIISRFDRRLISLDTAIMRRWAALFASLESIGRPLPIIDSFLAATALEHDLTIVTRNEDDFAPANVRVLNIWN